MHLRRVGGAVVLAGASAACILSWPSGSPTLHQARAGAATVSACSSDLSWSAEGTSLLSFQRANPTTVQGPASTSAVQPLAYESLPVNVTASGVYAFDFGPLNPGFAWGTNPPGAAFLAPPDFDGSVTPVASPEAPQVITINGQPYFQQDVSVVGAAACNALQLWMY